MTTEEEALAATRTRVGRFLQASFDRVTANDNGNFDVCHHGVLSHVHVVPWRGTIGVAVIVHSNAGMRADDDLTLLLATENARLPLGQFELAGWSLGTELWIAYDMLESELTRLELETVIESIGRLSARYGAAIHEWRGGRRPSALDRDAAIGEADDPPDDDNPAAVRALRFKIEGCLDKLDTAFAVDSAGDVLIEQPAGNAPVWVRPVAWTHGRTHAQVWAVTNEGMTVDGDLTRYLVDRNAGLPFCAFRLDLHGPQVTLGRALLGETLTARALGTVVECIVEAAEEHGPEIMDRFGGRLFTVP